MIKFKSDIQMTIFYLAMLFVVWILDAVIKFIG